MNDDVSMSRRMVVTGLAVGTVAAASGSIAASPSTPPTGPNTRAAETPALRDPATLHPKPPYNDTVQPWPGLVSKMSPKPDHGETSYRGTGRLTGRKALITGGDSGMGRAAAIAFAREGADVAINYLPFEESDAREVIDLIRAEGRTAVALPGDLREEAFCTHLVATARERLGGLDILVCNAALQLAVSNITELTSEQFDSTMKTNLYATFWLSKAAAADMPAGSSIINTVSNMAYDPLPFLLDYSATKAGLIAFTKVLAKQLGPKGIRVNAVCPGPIWTPLIVAGGTPPGRPAQLGSHTPFGRAGHPAELAPLYVMLASNELSYTNGSVFGATGGIVGP
ncbi:MULTISPECIES: SDR family oxidoreductase [Cupriavidus]